jgi:hypothetical protein
MYAKYDKYIDTAVDGLIFDIEHNLKAIMPLVFLYEPVGLTDLRSVSLYDSRISSIESRGSNVSRLSFGAAFQGYVSFVDVKNDKPDIESRIAKLESGLSNAIQQQKSFTTLSQWKEMNNLVDQDAQSVKDSLVIIQNDIETLKEDISNL